MTDLLILIPQVILLSLVALEDFRSMEIRVVILVLLTGTALAGIFLNPFEKNWLIDVVPFLIFAASTLITSLYKKIPVTGAADWWMLGNVCLLFSFPTSLAVLIGSAVSGVVMARIQVSDRSPFAGWLSVWMIFFLIFRQTGMNV